MITLEKLWLVKKNDYTTGCLFDYSYFNNCYKMISVDLIKQQALDADSKAIQQLILQEI